MESTTPPPDPQTASDPGATAPAGDDALARATAERDSYLDQLLRSRAEFANYQKRMRAQADADRAYAVAGLAADLLGSIDNLDRALEAARATGAPALVDGLALVHRQLHETLARHGVAPIEAVGLPFDPNVHEAITKRPSPDHPEGTVLAEVARGYRIGDRVLRPSRVVVSAGA